jgi:hypothetical protein
MVRELFKLLTDKTDEVLQIEEMQTKPELGGRRIVLKRIIVSKRIGVIPYKVDTRIEILWNPFKECVDKSLYTYRELGRKNKSLTDIWVVLKNDIEGKDVFTNVSAIKFERIIPCGSKELKKIKELVKKYYII